MTEIVMASIVGVASGYYIFNDIVQQVADKEDRREDNDGTDGNSTATEASRDPSTKNGEEGSA